MLVSACSTSVCSMLYLAGVCLCNGAAVKLWLMEHACGYSAVGDEGRHRVHARLCLHHFAVWRVLAAMITPAGIFVTDPP